MEQIDFKSLAIMAWLSLIENFSSPQGKRFFDKKFCGFCRIYEDFRCKGCPLAANEMFGCLRFNLFHLASDELKRITGKEHKIDFPEDQESQIFSKIAKVINEAFEKLKELPADVFSPAGTNKDDFKFLITYDKKMAKAILREVK